NLKLEANIEYRFPIAGSLFGALFLDAGNVWLLKADENRPGGAFSWRSFGKDVALGTGAGLRLDITYIVLRFDVGVPIHAPYDTGKSGYYNINKFWKNLGYHLAIGYPF
ncbi:MAG: BamA/TamA family outer membrane protein, partial [Bacteroidales bacterium]